MSGPNPPESESEEQEPVIQPIEEIVAEHTGGAEAYSQAYSAPEAEHFMTGPYVPADPRLYDYEYDDYGGSAEQDDETATPRWPWVVGVAAITAAIALVVSVALVVTGTDTDADNLAVPATPVTTSAPPVQDEITPTTSEPPPPSPTSEEPPPPPPPTSEQPPPPPPPVVVPEPPPPAPSSEAPEPVTTTPPTTTTTTPTTTVAAGPRQVTYSVTGTKAPGDIITVTYIDASGRRVTRRNVYIPWSLTVTPISQSEVGSVEASSLFRVSRLNCSITTNDGILLSSNTSDAPQTSC